MVTEVSEFMETILDDCSGENLHVDSDFPSNPGETTFLALRVLTAVSWVSLYADDDGCDDGVKLSSADVFRWWESWERPCRLPTPAWSPHSCDAPGEKIFHCPIRRQLYRP